MRTNGQILAPQKRIAESCKDNENLTVQLQQEVPVNEIGTPQYSEWTISAFMTHRGAKQADVHPASEAKTSPPQAADGFREATPTEAKEKAESKEYSIEDEMKEYARCEALQQINSGQFASELELEAAFLYDWGRLKMESMEKDAKERERLQEILLDHFSAVNAAYMHYAVGSGETAYGMTGPEFAHFVHECGLYHVESDHALIEKAFVQTTRHEAFVSPHAAGTLSRVGFLHALIRVMVTSATRDGENNGVMRDIIEKSLKERVAITVAKLTTGPFRDQTHDERIIAIFQEAKNKLQRLYTLYAGCDNPQRSEAKMTKEEGPVDESWPKLLRASELRSMLYDSGVFCVGDSPDHEDMFNQALTQCFSENGDLLEQNREPELVFAEFIEVVVRMALAVLKEHELPTKDAVKIALDALRSLPCTKASNRE